jgi:hypothetical protein
MYAQILAAVLLIPLGLSTLMRGSDGLNAGKFGAGEAGTMAVAGAGMILSGIALLIGALVAGALALIALGAATVVWFRQRRRALGRRLQPRDLAGRTVLLSAITLLLIAGWQ